MAHAFVARPLPSVRNVLFATDFSACSRAALPYVCAITKRFGTSLHLIHVVGPEPLVGPAGEPYADYDDEVARRELTKFASMPALNGIRQNGSIHRGAVHNVVCRLVPERYIDLVILGSHGRRGLSYLLRGSAAEQILRRATCPVLIIGPGVCKRVSRDGSFSTIVFATDFSPASIRCLRYALSVGCGTNSRLIVLHSIGQELPQPKAASINGLQRAIDEIKNELLALLPPDLPIHVDGQWKRGSPADAILQTAAEVEADLIMMVAHPGTAVASHSPRSIAHRLLCSASCPVMAIPSRPVVH